MQCRRDIWFISYDAYTQYAMIEDDQDLVVGNGGTTVIHVQVWIHHFMSQSKPDIQMMLLSPILGGLQKM